MTTRKKEPSQEKVKRAVIETLKDSREEIYALNLKTAAWLIEETIKTIQRAWRV